MRSWLRKFVSPLMVWHLLGLFWFAQLVLTATMIAFRAVKTAGIAGAFQLDDVPLLQLLDTYYSDLYFGMAISGLTLAAMLSGLGWWRGGFGNPFRSRVAKEWNRRQWTALAGMVLFTGFVVVEIIACRPVWGESVTGSVHPISLLDWLGVVLLASCGWLAPAIITFSLQTVKPARIENRQEPASAGAGAGWIFRNGGFYLLGCGAVFLYALTDHLKFWNPAANGGYDYRPFFRDGEIPNANLVLYSTSILFASIATLGGCLLISLFRSVLSPDEPKTGTPNSDSAPEAGPDRVDAGWGVTRLSAFVWAAMLSLPWQIKIWPEIEAERGWILPAVTLVFISVALLPLLQISWLMMSWDFQRRALARIDRQPESTPFLPRRSELAIWNFVLFPVYPWIRWARAAGAVVLYATITLASGGAIFALTWAAAKADDLYTFDDWRGMLKSGQFPFLRVAFALLCACFAYVVLRRMILAGKEIVSRSGSRLPQTSETLAAPEQTPNRLFLAARTLVLILAVANLGLATWPFWGWRNVSENVFARTSEYSYRHQFELKFLHWLFDFDRDGYAAVLHGADPDDFDSAVQPGNIDPLRNDNPVPIDHFAIADRHKAREMPNVLILFLEGVTPKSISAYGERQVVGTPHIDAIAREGTIFKQARCFYPSTWDAWFATVSGRYLRIREFDVSRPFGDRYSRYNSLHRVLTLAGVNRWCHADTSPYFDMLVPKRPGKSSQKAWMTKYDSSVSTKEKSRGIWRGDKRNDRMMKFLDDLKPGDKFFMCEHMCDTHFPWTGIEGLEWASQDAVLHNGKRDVSYGNYFQAITRMDQQVGKLMQKLKEKHLYDNTMIIIVSDHGCQWWEHEHMYYVSHLYDQTLLVPLIVRLPERFSQGNSAVLRGGVVTDPVLQVDILPTMMDLAGVRQTDRREDYPLPGLSLLPLMSGKATAKQRRDFEERDVPLTTHYDKLGVISRFRHKLIFNRPAGTYKLFDLKTDPREMINLADDRPELLREMLAKLRKLIHENPAIIGGIKKSKNAD